MEIVANNGIDIAFYYQTQTHTHGGKKAVGGEMVFQVNENNTLSIISIRQTVIQPWIQLTKWLNWMVFPAILPCNGKKIAPDAHTWKNWTLKHIDSIFYAIARFIFSQFIACLCRMQSACMEKTEPNQTHVWECEWGCVCIGKCEIITARQCVNNRKLTEDKQWNIE